jgi:DNA adenine methylase
MNLNNIYTPLRYPGGKAKFAPFLMKLLEYNNFVSGHYLEPYAGGAGVALDLLFNNYVEHIYINDIDPAIYHFWIAITKKTKDFLELLESTPITMKQWYKWRSILKGDIKATLLEKGFATLFMNRTNMSGILSAGVIGGKEQDGKYKLDARFNKDALIKRIEKISEYKKQISIYNEDALLLLKSCKDKLPKNTFVYLDPPYYVKGQKLYRNFYEHKDHLAISKILRSKVFKLPWIVSYDNVPQICDMYNKEKKISYQLQYSAKQKRLGEEVAFISSNLTFPRKLPII